MNRASANSISRRRFLASTAMATAAASAGTVIGAPAVITPSKTNSQIIVGTGDYRYEILHAWPQLPDKYTWQTTHNVAVDAAGNLYVIHEGNAKLKDHPSIFVFDDQGKFMRAFGSEYQGGGHGIEVRQEGGEEFLYVCGYQQVKMFAKMSLKGDVVWRKHAPMESGVYAEGEASNPKKIWGRNRFMPTNFAFLDGGDFLLADGYGSFYIHRYDKDGNWKSHFGGPGKGKGKFQTPHGIWLDKRPGRKPLVAVCDRANHAVQYLTLEGQYVETLTGYGLPANIDTWNDLLVVPELHARVTLLNSKNEVVAQLGADVERIKSIQGIRNKAELWKDGRFVHPHDACFAKNGDIFVAEWVATGRVSRMKRLA